MAVTPRLEQIPVRPPLRPAWFSGPICENQTVAKRRYFGGAST
jgi:hypothetical protein